MPVTKQCQLVHLKTTFNDRGFIKVFNRRATELDTRVKSNWQDPENFEILWSQGHVFLHFEAADNDFQQPKKDNFSRQFNRD